MKMNDSANVEIYLLLPNSTALLGWVEDVVGNLDLVCEQEDVHIYHAHRGGSKVAVTITPRMEDGKFTSVFFSGSNLPWSTDAECARAAVDSLGIVARCVPPSGSQDENQWLEVSPNGEHIVTWEASS